MFILPTSKITSNATTMGRMARELECEQCGRPFIGQRTTARYCGSSCRVRAAKERASKDAPVVRLPSASKPRPAADEPTPSPAAEDGPGPVEVATRAALDEAEDVPAARAALCIALARKLDFGARADTASAFATGVARLDAMLTEIAKASSSATLIGSMRDELGAFRARRGSA